MRHSCRVTLRTLLVAVAVATAPVPATAGPFGDMLEYLRDYDLNDYALGIAISASQSPYRAGHSSIFPYPYLTSFTNPAFTRDWLLVSDDAGTGARYVTEDGFFEVGAVGRIKSGGFGTNPDTEYFELRERLAALELGAYVGWRRWPAHFQLRGFNDVLGRHNGGIGEFSVSWPINREWGFVIPMVEAVYQSADHNRYYYGVSDAEAAPGRPAYTPGADTNIRVRLRGGYRLSDRWLLTGYVQMESLGDEIRNSPIVNKDRVYSYNLGLAYNADLFNPRDYPYASDGDTRVDVRVGAFFDNVSTEIQFANLDGRPGDIIDVESDGGAAESKWVPELDVFLRFGNYHRLDFGYFEIGRSGSKVTLVPRSVGTVDVPIGESFDVSSRIQVIRAIYTYSFMRDAQKELGIGGGLHRSKIDIEVVNADGDRQILSGDALLPVIGAHGSVRFGEKTRLGARLQFFASSFDDYDGYTAFGSLEWARQVTATARVGIALNLYLARLESTRGDFDGTYRTLHVGPSLFFAGGF